MSTVTLSQRELKRRRKLGAEYVAPSPYTLKAALEKGDIFTKLSALVFGLGNIVHKQYVKGLLFLAGEVGFILFMIFGCTQPVHAAVTRLAQGIHRMGGRQACAHPR